MHKKKISFLKKKKKKSQKPSDSCSTCGETNKPFSADFSIKEGHKQRRMGIEQEKNNSMQSEFSPGWGSGKWSQVIVMCDNYYYCTPAPPY